MGKTSTDAKRRYNEKAYDRVSVTVPKGMKEVYLEQAKQHGFKSLNGYINDLLKNDMKKSLD